MKTSNNTFIYMLLLCCFTVGSVTTVYAQEQPPLIYFETYGNWADNEDPRSYKHVIQRYENEIQQGDWVTVFAGLRDEFEETETDWSGNEDVYEKFLAEFDALVLEFLDIYLADNVYIYHLDQITTSRFHESTINAFPRYFSNESNEIKICPETGDAGFCEGRPRLTQEQAFDLRYRGNTLQLLLRDFKDEPREIIAQRIEESHKRWVNYIDNGYTMYPWESVINAKFFRWSIKSPPKGQIILLHPGAGVQLPLSLLDDFSVNDIRVSQSLIIEVLGILKYRGDFGENYWGLSGTIALQDNLGPGFGVNAHLRRNISLGLNWHLSNQPNRTFQKEPHLTISFNLLDWVTSNKKYLDRVFK